MPLPRDRWTPRRLWADAYPRKRPTMPRPSRTRPPRSGQTRDAQVMVVSARSRHQYVVRIVATYAQRIGKPQDDIVRGDAIGIGAANAEGIGDVGAEQIVVAQGDAIGCAVVDAIGGAAAVLEYRADAVAVDAAVDIGRRVYPVSVA